jgi:DNA-binding Lrp family transcriptional regulator
LEELAKASAYMNVLDKTNAQIIGALSKHGPRNLSLIAESVGLPNSTLMFRIKRLVEKLDLEVNARANFNKLGLARAIVFAEALPGQWDTLWKVMENSDYFTYLTKYYGASYGCYGIFAFPIEKKNSFPEYFQEAKKLHLLSNVTLFWTTNLREVHPNFELFDFAKKEWSFHWEKWIEEVKYAKCKFPENLSDPEDYPTLADKKDLFLLRLLEKNGLASFQELSKTVGLSPRSVAYRYEKHLVERKLIVDYMVHFFPYPYQKTNVCTFIIQFADQKNLARFVNTLENKPYILSYAKVIGENTLLTNTYIPASEFLGFLDSLNRLAKLKIVKNFSHVTLTLLPHKRGGVPYEHFRNGKWDINFDQSISKLKLFKKAS